MAREVSIGPVAGAILKPRYAKINAFLGEDYMPCEEGIDIFIDLNALVSALSTSAKFLNSLPFSDGGKVEADIISNVLSVLKHWKDWSRKYDNARLFLLVNDFEMVKLPEQDIIKSYLVPYVSKFDQERFAQMNYFWTESMKKVEIVLKYVPQSYLIRCNRVDSYIIPNIIDNYKTNNRSRLIITSNPLMTMYGLEPNTNVILSKFKHQMSDMGMIVKSISNIDDPIMDTFIKNKVFYGLLNAIIGDFDRGMIGITQLGISTFANDLLRAVERGEIPKDPKTIDSVLPVINQGYHDYLRKTFMLVDISNHTLFIPQSLIEKIKSNMVDLYDIDAFRGMSVDGFNLMELL